MYAQNFENARYIKMTLREKILKTFVVTIREINTHGGPKEFFENPKNPRLQEFLSKVL